MGYENELWLYKSLHSVLYMLSADNNSYYLFIIIIYKW